ncbi:MAG: pitrilysin family protein [Candidatus Dojkabacteria bacterium]|nr:pitrilysin family protein [Candidatus Dojkabacteria bacterium]
MENLRINYSKFVLPNGIKCILYNREEIHSVTVRVNVNVGALDETATTTGLSHFIEHVAAGDGTKDLPTWEALDKFKNDHSGSSNAYTTYDHTQYYGTFPYQYLKEALFYFSQQVLHPLIRTEDVEKERTIILDEMRRYDDDIYHNVYKNIKENRFQNKKTQFSYDIIGTKKRLAAYTRENLRNFYEDYYIPENIEVYIVGNIDEEEAKKYLEEYFYKDIKNRRSGRSKEREFKEKYPDYSKFNISAVQKLDIDQYYLSINFPSPEFSLRKAEDRFRVDFLAAITASGQYSQSVLWKKLREELNLVYGISAFTYDYLYSRNFFTIFTSFNKENLSTILKEVYNGVNQIKYGKITESIFKSRQKKLIDTQLMQLDKPANVLNWITSSEDELEAHEKEITIPYFLNYIENETFENIIEIGKEIFDWSKVNIGLVSKDSKKDAELLLRSEWEKIALAEDQIKLIK